MRLYITLILAATMSLSMSCSASPPARVEITGPIKLVEFPEPWLKRKGNAEVGVNDSIQYVVRKSKDRQELLFAAKQGFDGSLFGKAVSDFPVLFPNYDYYSDNRFAVNIDGPLQIKPVTDEEWYTSEQLLQSYYFIQKWDLQVTPEGVRYDARTYRKSGETWANEVALISPRKTRIAVFSYTSREKVSESIIPGLKNTEPGSGEVFLDIYDLASGEKVAGVRSPFGRKPNGFAPSMLFGASVWIEDRYIVMPLDPNLERALLGVFPEK